jgi:hypothetical protein
MAITTSGTTLTFNDATTQTTAPVNTNANVTSATAVAGTGISITAVTTTGAATHTVTNTGVTSAAAGRGVSVSASTGAVTTSLAAGTVLQVLQTVKQDTFSTTSGTFVDITGLSVTITPSATSSKILVKYTVHYSGVSDLYGAINLQKNGSNLVVGTGGTGNQTNCTGSMPNGASGNFNYKVLPASFEYLDSPASVSALTYKLQVATYNSRTFLINSPNTTDNSFYNYFPVSTITVMEIAG